MIPKVRDWRVRVIDDNAIEIDRRIISAPTKRLAHLNHRFECYQFWGKALVISPIKQGVINND